MTPTEFRCYSLESMQKGRRGQGFLSCVRRATLFCMHCVSEGTNGGILCSPDRPVQRTASRRHVAGNIMFVFFRESFDIKRGLLNFRRLMSTILDVPHR